MSNPPSSPGYVSPYPLPPLAALECATLDWREDATGEAPHSTRYEDVYFSRHDGRAETEHVFIQHNHLPERFAAWQASRPFVIGETGFGTGLNMLCAWACFERHAPASARLHLVSTEKHPLTRDDLERALAVWPDFTHKARILIAQWPEPVSGVHRLVLNERITLDLHFGDSAERLSRLDGKVDAWFLDGFAPARNPDMWQPALFEAMAAHSHPGATFATFTCAGFVKRGLRAAGFNWEKVPGFGRKREMLRGRIDTPPIDGSRHATPWFVPPETCSARHVAVIGAGLAGASVAEALARRGVKVTLLDREAPGAGASGNRQGALYVKLAAETNLQSRVYLAGLLHTRRWLARLDPTRELWQDGGVLQLAMSDKEAQRQSSFMDFHRLPTSVVEAVDAARAGELAGTPLSRGGLDYPGAGWVRPAALCQRLAATAGVHFHRGEVTSLTSTGIGWQLTLANGDALAADQVVVATAWQAPLLAPLAWLPLRPIRGQVSEVRVPSGMPTLSRVVCAGGYAPPAIDGVQCFGATFAPGDTGTELREADHAANLAELKRTLPAYVAVLADAGVDWAQMDGRAALRAATPDKTPYAGPAPDAERWLSDYAGLAKDARRTPSVPGQHHRGLWVSTGHGSRGLASAPLCAEVIASRICDEPLPLERDLIDHLHPGRRLIADLIRGRHG
ncbi:bifunctional tRNA (5-methylaminomethyl-2-thiouridine)(34)-methyltransferase MnmD/FAD-dependent 5-carboxymethylaminomethyl-2-thiouridine(34) oxidoreductase MnmC [Modicisalibacter luteus]|uniref:tRNA 5-methylaminomethyl-2-thiouridine biosynthesis bifunctional protein MnmC n=1 Tax=Modicisalibacter luteus TaxID=453962 RepID=A0ABV7M872_9GAMM|nr:bifunctional tRNA (5-methylaminomethyl-2-thiouridine)(34)-methyltransferase MnmD/FAD-dependent 5-carboxymethylaminomethyl-2-thiouridine(34) oxidoreductase MnmC [Halomonas lutea]GHA98979.1 tRNA 5-methylaminomethyl-2-thiouridine biosynthesis bifunctional protein MnmC [Halomonas lutea]